MKLQSTFLLQSTSTFSRLLAMPIEMVPMHSQTHCVTTETWLYGMRKPRKHHSVFTPESCCCLCMSVSVCY